MGLFEYFLTCDTQICRKPVRNMISCYFVIIVIFLGLFTGTLMDCPDQCMCRSKTMECFQVMPGIIPHAVTKVTVYEATLGQKFNFSGSGWGSVTYLAINPGTSVFHNRPEAFRTLHYLEFFALKNLEYLQIACKCLKLIQKHAFYGLNKVKVLDLSNNIRLNIEMIVQGLEGVLPYLTELYLRNISVLVYHPFYINSEFFDAVRNKPLKVLDISDTENAVLSRNSDLQHAFPHLETLNLSGAGIVAVSVVNVFTVMSFSIPAVSSFRQLKVIDFSYPSTSSKMTDLVFETLKYGNFYFYFPPNITEAYGKRIFDAPLSLKGTSNSTHTCVQHKKALPICIFGKFDDLNKLVVSENSLTYLDPNLLHACKSVQYVDISKNELGKAISEDSYARSIMDILHNLEVLIASENNIFTIPEDSFQSSKLLKILDLSKNKLESITFQTSYLASLQKLDISNNKIVFLDALSQSRLTYLQNMPFQNSTLNSSEFILNLKGNPFKCFCGSVKFLTWLESQNETYMCLLNTNTAMINYSSIKKSEYKCKENIVTIIFSILSFVEAIIIAVAVYQLIIEIRRRKQRKKIRKGIKMYEMNAVKENRKTAPPVFLSFCSEDEEIVMDQIYPNLDKGLKKILNIESRCVATGGTDFQPGLSLANEIIRCIEASSVVVFFVTNAFCKKSWCKNEALVAHCDNKPTVLMIWEKVNVKLMPKHLYKHYLQYTRVHWVIEDGQRVMKPDSNKLCEAIVKLIGENPQTVDV